MPDLLYSVSVDILDVVEHHPGWTADEVYNWVRQTYFDDEYAAACDELMEKGLLREEDDRYYASTQGVN